MTMRELAKIANVSLSTVSKAFSDAEDISEDTRKYIFKIAKEHGCYGKFYKGKYSKKMIGIICPELESSYYISFVEHLKKIMTSNNVIPIIATDQFNGATQSELIDYFDGQLKLDGILIFELKTKLKQEHNCPIISLFSSADDSIDSVNIDFESAISDAVKLLKNFGHKKIAFLGERLTTPKSDLFKKVMTEMGEKNPCIIQSNYRFEKAGDDGIKNLLATTTDYTAIICAYDNIAYGAMKRLRKLGFHVPEDYSIIGIDNINASESLETSLSSIGTNIDEFCVIVWDLLEKKIKNKLLQSNQQIVLKSNLIIRDSIKNLKVPPQT